MMTSIARSRGPSHRAWLWIAAALLLAAPAYAHKLKVFAMAEGATISGYVYFPGGGRAAGVQVKVMGPNRQMLGEVKTNDKGEFVFKATRACDHKFVADSGDGHRAEFLVSASELAGDLKPPAAGPAKAPALAPAAEPPGPAPLAVGLSEARLAQIVAQTVSKQVRPLREQIERYEERRRIADIVGGIGYVFGIMGLLMMLKRGARPSQ